MSRVYLLADDPRLRQNLELELRRHRHVVHSCTMGEFFAGDLREFEADVLIMDLATDGACAPARLAMLRDPMLAEIPLVAVAATAEEARAFGAQAFLPRRFEPADILDVVDALLHPLGHEAR
jgi:DNA-binding response OmpR family regulator